MERRMPNLQDGSHQDIIDICSAIEQVFLSFKQGEAPYIYIINLLELLLQSARTRVCILRFPKEDHRKHYTPEALKKDTIVFANFRDRALYEHFCQSLQKELNNPRSASAIHFIKYELEKLPSAEEDLYFCLPRVILETQQVELNHAYNKEAYFRLRQFLQTILVDQNNWGINLVDELYECFNAIPQDSKLNCADGCEFPLIKKANNQEYTAIDETFQKEALEPIHEWVSYVYDHVEQSPLVHVAHPTKQGKTATSDDDQLDYSNLFFFLRVNRKTLPPQGTTSCENFDVHMICPPKQIQQLSHYYHRHHTTSCQWYQKDGGCKIKGMSRCELADTWGNLPAGHERWTSKEIEEHYHHLWQPMTESTGASLRSSETVFRSHSIVFERYARQENPDFGFVRIDPDNNRDRIMACIRYRMLPLTEHPGGEDNVPQMMFVPIYAGGSPQMLAAMVVNANKPQNLQKTMSEWRLAYRFAGMVMQSLSSRYKEAVRKAYLNAVADLVEDMAYNAKQAKKGYETGRYDELLTTTNAKLENLSIIYPFRQIKLEKLAGGVNNNDRQVIHILDSLYYRLSLMPNQHWCHYADKTFFSSEDVARKCESAISRSIARDHHEQRAIIGQDPDLPGNDSLPRTQ